MCSGDGVFVSVCVCVMCMCDGDLCVCVCVLCVRERERENFFIILLQFVGETTVISFYQSECEFERVVVLFFILFKNHFTTKNKNYLLKTLRPTLRMVEYARAYCRRPRSSTDFKQYAPGRMRSLLGT